MAILCCFCQISVKVTRNIFKYHIDEKPQLLLKDIILEIMEATSEFELYELGKEICLKCCNKVIKYHKTAQQLKIIREELIKLIENVTKQLKNCKVEEIEEKPDQTLSLNESFLAHEVEHINIDAEKRIYEDTRIKEEEQSSEESLYDTVFVEAHVSHSESDDDDDNDDELDTKNNKFEFLNDDKKLDESGEIKCTQCDKIFTNQRKFQAHNQKEHSAGYICEICGRTLQSYTGLYHHMKNHQPENECKCAVCGKEFNNKDKLKHHMAWHSGEQPFQCDVCSKKFVHRKGLQRHKLIHDKNIRRIECGLCGLKFRSKSHLDRHMNTHTGARPFCCPVCGKCFSQMYNMKRHMKEHQEPGSTREQRYKCKKCPRTFTNKENYEQHCQKANCADEDKMRFELMF